MTVLEQNYYHAVINLAHTMSEILRKMNDIEKLLDEMHKSTKSTDK